MNRVNMMILAVVYILPSMIFLASLLLGRKIGIGMSGVAFTIIISSFYYLTTRRGYVPDGFDYYYIIISGFYLIFQSFVNRYARPMKRTEKIFDEEKEWWNEMKSKEHIGRK